MYRLTRLNDSQYDCVGDSKETASVIPFTCNLLNRIRTRHVLVEPDAGGKGHIPFPMQAVLGEVTDDDVFQWLKVECDVTVNGNAGACHYNSRGSERRCHAY